MEKTEHDSGLQSLLKLVKHKDVTCKILTKTDKNNNMAKKI